MIVLHCKYKKNSTDLTEIVKKNGLTIVESHKHSYKDYTVIKPTLVIFDKKLLDSSNYNKIIKKHNLNKILILDDDINNLKSFNKLTVFLNQIRNENFITMTTPMSSTILFGTFQEKGIDTFLDCENEYLSSTMLEGTVVKNSTIKLNHEIIKSNIQIQQNEDRLKFEILD